MKSPKEIGELLKETRRKKNLTIDEAYNKTRIQPNIIEALEKGEGNEILGSIYTVLFLKKYASFLGLDGARLVEGHKDFYPDKEEVALVIEGPPKAINIDLQKWIVPAIYAGLGLIVIFFILFLGFKIKSSRRARIARTETENSLRATSAKPIPFPVIPKKKPIVLVLKANDAVWMKVKKDGKRAFEGTLSKGKEKKWSAGDKIELWVGRAEALDFTINRTPVGIVGKGNVKDIQISRRGLKIKNKWLLKAKD
jgi:transcriptional regulator with XRE-family HTH domain